MMETIKRLLAAIDAVFIRRVLRFGVTGVWNTGSAMRILEFALAIEEEIGVSGGGLLSGSPASKEKVNQMVQTNIYGGNIAIIAAADNIPVSFLVPPLPHICGCTI